MGLSVCWWMALLSTSATHHCQMINLQIIERGLGTFLHMIHRVAVSRSSWRATPQLPSICSVSLPVIIDPRYESILSGLRIQTPAKSTSNWLEKNLRAVSTCRIHVTNFKTLSLTKGVQKLCVELYQSPAKALHEAPYEALQKLHQKLYQRLYSTSTHPVYWPRSKWSSAQGGPRGSPP